MLLFQSGLFALVTTRHSLTNNFLTQYVDEHFTPETQIKVEYVAIPRSSDGDKIQVLMASDSAPDICFTYSDTQFYSYASAGGLTEVTDEMFDTYAPDLKSFLGSEVLNYGQYEGKQLSIPSKRIITVGDTAHIRKDLLDALDIPMPTTTEELYQALKAVHASDPTLVPYGMHGSTTGTLAMNYYLLIHAFIDPNMSEEDFYSLPPEMQPGAREGFRLLNKMYNEGMISKEFALDDSGKQFNQDMVTGKMVFFIDNGSGPYSVDGNQEKLQQNVPGAQFYPIDPFVNSEGKHRKTVYAPYGRLNMIPKASSKKAPQALQYLNWLQQNMMTMKYGIEGTHYNMVDGLPMPIEENRNLIKRDLWKANDMYLILNEDDFGSMDKNIEYAALKTAYPELTALAIENGLRDGYVLPRFDRPIEAENKYGNNLYEVLKELAIKCIMSTPEQFDSTYDAMCQKWREQGGQKVMDEKIEALHNMKK